MGVKSTDLTHSKEGRHFLKMAMASVCVITCLCAITLPVTGVAHAADITPKEMITNGDFEAGTNSWTGGTLWNASASTIAAETSDVHGGSQALKVTGRTSDDGGAKQNIGDMQKGDTYAASMWIKATEDATFNFTICSANASGCAQLASAAVKAGNWTQIKGTTVLTNDKADFVNSSLVIETVYGSKKLGDFLVDDVSLTNQSNVPVVRPEGTAAPAKKAGENNPIIDYWYGADPWAMEYNGRVYVYTTGDATAINDDGSISYDYEYDAKGNIKDNSFAKVQTLNVLSSDDMSNWRNEGYIRVAGKNGVAKWANNSWAPAAAHKTINGKEKFFLYFANGGSGIGVLTSDSPVGPWTDGGNLVKWGTQASQGVAWLFDPAVFVDSDGTGYLYYGGGVPDGKKEHPGTARVIKLSDDMTHTVGDAQVIDAPAMFEDSGIAKIGNKYYYSYCTNFSHENVIDGHKIGYGNIAYMTADSPMGPFTYQDEIMQNPGSFFNVSGNNHHAMVQLGNSWYMVYHAQTVAKELTQGGNLDHARGYRNTHFDPMTVNADGSIDPITMTYKGLSQVKNLNAYQEGGIPASTIARDSGIQDAYNTESGVRVIDLTTDNSQGQMLGNINDGEWTSLSQVDFGKLGAKSLTVNAAGIQGGDIEVRLDSNDSTPVATINVAAGDGVTYADYTAELQAVSGVHDVFFTFRGTKSNQTLKSSASDFLFNIKTYNFVENTPAPSVDKAGLQAEVGIASGLQQSKFTAKSWSRFAAAMQKAQQVLSSADSSQSDVNAALQELQAARAALSEVPANAGADTKPTTPSQGQQPAQADSSQGGLAATGVDMVALSTTAVFLLIAAAVCGVARARRRS